MTGGLRLGAWLVCLGLLGAGFYLALLAPGQAAFDRTEGKLLEVNTQTTGTPANPDRIRKLSVVGAACHDYDYLESWAKQVGLPAITDVNANDAVTIYTDQRSCAGFNAGGSAQVRALVYHGKLYSTAAYLHPHNDRLANLPAALLLLLTGAAGVVLILRRHFFRRLAPTHPAPLN